MLRFFIYIAGIISVSHTPAVNGALLSYGTCVSAYNDTGLCIHMDDCQYIFSMILSNNLGGEDRENLRKSQCGFDNTQTAPARRVLVCCPDKYCKDPVTEPGKIPEGNILPAAGICGHSLSDRIYGGNVTRIDEFPWMALIQYKKPNNVLEFLCGGSLINSRYILTAAHCVRNPDMPTTWEVHQVRLGEWEQKTNPDCEVDTRGVKECAPPHVDVGVESTAVHPKYIPGSRDQYHDVALIRMSQTVAYTRFIKPICLPVAPEIYNNMFKGTTMDVAGWGATSEHSLSSSVKLKIFVNIWDIPACQDLYKTFQIVVNGTQQMCAGGSDGVDTCRGDSGGPLMANERVGSRDISFIVGIVSYGPRPCGVQGWPGVYTRVGNYIDWIQSNMVA